MKMDIMVFQSLIGQYVTHFPNVVQGGADFTHPSWCYTSYFILPPHTHHHHHLLSSASLVLSLTNCWLEMELHLQSCWPWLECGLVFKDQRGEVSAVFVCEGSWSEAGGLQLPPSTNSLSPYPPNSAPPQTLPPPPPDTHTEIMMNCPLCRLRLFFKV